MTVTTEEDPGISVLAVMMHAMGVPPMAGACRDCNGIGVIPDIDMSEAVNRGIWKTCPTCFGQKKGGSA